MFSRRQLCLGTGMTASTLALSRFGTLGAYAAHGVQANSYGVSVHYENGAWDLKADQVAVGGLPVPIGTWAWIGITIAGGVVSAVGGLIVSLIVSFLTRKSEPDIAALMHNVSAAIAAGHTDLLDWQNLRTRIKNESTNLGGAMVQEWLKAPAKLDRKRKEIVHQDLG